MCYTAKYDTVFDESLELSTFPIDRQLCRLRITAEMPVEDFQFIVLATNRHLAKLPDMWEKPKGLQGDLRAQTFEKFPCTVYVRYSGARLPSDILTQRSLVNVVLHVQRKPQFFLHTVVLMVLLINCISLGSFAIRLSPHSGRLSFLSTCFLAVLAYRYVVNDSLPKKSEMTYADKYLTLVCLFQTVLCLWTCALMGAVRILEFWEESTMPVVLLDFGGGFVALAALLGFHAYLYRCFKRNESQRQDWQEVYQGNREPFLPMDICTDCNTQWPSLQCRSAHLQNRCPICGAAAKSTIFHTPLDVPVLDAQRKCASTGPVVPSLEDWSNLWSSSTSLRKADRVEAYLLAGIGNASSRRNPK